MRIKMDRFSLRFIITGILITIMTFVQPVDPINPADDSPDPEKAETGDRNK